MKITAEDVAVDHEMNCGCGELECRECRMCALVRALEAVRVAAVDFYAMVEGEAPSLLEDDCNALRLDEALAAVDRIRQ